MHNEKRSKQRNVILIIVTTALNLAMLDTILFADYNAFNALPSTENEKAIAYSQLKEHEKQLKEDIRQYKEERAAKVEYLADLDMRYAELEAQYNELLKQKKLISDKLADVNME